MATPMSAPQPESERVPAPPGAPRREPRYVRADRIAQRRNRIVRLAVLAAGLVVVTLIGLGHQLGWGKVVGVDALCPFGGIETLWSLVFSATYLQRIAASSVVLLGIVFVSALVFRRSFCGYICPFGALQELFSRVGARLLSDHRPTLPAAVDRPARLLKYVVLGVFAVWTWQAAELVMRPYDPWVAFMHLGSSDLAAAIGEFTVGFVVLGVALVGSVVYDRFFCRYLCPMGAFLAVVSRVSFFKVRRDVSSCIDCKACDKVCPVGVRPSVVETVRSPECIDCGECVNACPVKDTLVVAGPKRFSGRRFSLGSMTVLGSVVAIIAVGIALSTAGGTFAWSTPGLGLVEQGQIASPSTFNVESVKGSMALDEVAAATGIPREAFIEHFGITEAQMGEPMKEFIEEKGFSVRDDVRAWVQQQLEAAGG